MVHLVKVGLLGAVGRFRSLDLKPYSRGTAVICRTERGLENGEVLCSIDDHVKQGHDQIDGELLRQVGSEDRLILERLDRYRDRAFRACQKLIIERGLVGVLVDVEHLFDGESVYFYFLGEVTHELESLTEELASTYEQKVRFKKFVEKLVDGCGPGCGTEASKCSSGGCGSCGLSAHCGS